MAIAWKDQGTSAATATSGTALVPKTPGLTDANDIGIVLVWYRDTTTTPSTPSGYTLLTGPHTIVGSRMWLFGKLMAAGDDNVDINFGTSGGTVLRMAQVYTFSGYSSGTITDVVTGFTFEEGATATIADVDVTTSINGALAANFVAIEDDLPSPSFSPTNTGVSGGTWVEDSAEIVSSLGNDGTIGMQTCALATAGTIGGGTFTRGAADNWGIIGFEVRPQSPGATGTVAVTQADDTSSASGQLGYSGTSTATQEDQTSSASGTVSGPVTGTVAATQEDQTSTASGTVSGPVTGTVAVTQADQTSTASGQLGYSGTSAATQADQTSTASGQLSYSGSSATTQADQTSAAAGQLGYTGTTAATQEDQPGSASGTVAGVGEISGSAAVTQDDQTPTATGQLGYTGTTGASQDAQTATAAGTVINPVTGSLAVIQGDQVGAAAGQLGYTGSSVVVQADQISAANGTFAIAITGLVAALQSDQVAAATGFVGVIPIPAGRPLVTGSGVHMVTANGSVGLIAVSSHAVTAGPGSHAVEVE